MSVPVIACGIVSLVQEKEAENMENTYNHNFQGLYCTCERPYPDSEDEVGSLHWSIVQLLI